MIKEIYWNAPVIQIQHNDFGEWNTILWTNRNMWKIVFEALEQYYSAEEYRAIDANGEIIEYPSKKETHNL